MCPACEVPWKATVRFADVPADPAQQTIMEEQIRRAYAIPTIYDHFKTGKTPKSEVANQICKIFAKQGQLSPQDLDFLNDQGRKLFEPYTATS